MSQSTHSLLPASEAFAEDAWLAEAGPGAGVGAYRVDLNWRGESAYYVESTRKLWMHLSREPGVRSIVKHVYGMWEYNDGRCEEATEEERMEVLQKTLRFAREQAGVLLFAPELEGTPRAA